MTVDSGKPSAGRVGDRGCSVAGPLPLFGWPNRYSDGVCPSFAWRPYARGGRGRVGERGVSGVSFGRIGSKGRSQAKQGDGRRRQTSTVSMVCGEAERVRWSECEKAGAPALSRQGGNLDPTLLRPTDLLVAFALTQLDSECRFSARGCSVPERVRVACNRPMVPRREDDGELLDEQDGRQGASSSSDSDE